jgi:hypothetical protein
MENKIFSHFILFIQLIQIVKNFVKENSKINNLVTYPLKFSKTCTLHNFYSN